MEQSSILFAKFIVQRPARIVHFSLLHMIVKLAYQLHVYTFLTSRHIIQKWQLMICIN